MSCPNPQNEHILMLNPDTYPGEVVRFAWPGGYPVFYLTADSGVLCPECVQEDLSETQCNGEHATCDPSNPGFYVVAHGVNWEDPELYCDHCSERIESAYAEDSTHG
jgi:hypothetical protein